MAEADSYCAIADTEARAQMGAYGAGTTPTSTQVLSFAEQRTGEIYSWMREVIGTDAPGPANYSTTIDTGTDAGLALNDVVVMANAIGAAMDALEAAGAGSSPARSERIVELGTAYSNSKDAVQAAAKAYVGYSERAATHHDEGRVTVDTFTSRTQEGFAVDGSTEF